MQTESPISYRRFPFRLPTLLVVLTLAAGACLSLGGLAPVGVWADDAKNPFDDPAYQRWWDAHRLELRDLVNGGLKPDAERAAIASLANDFPAPHDLNDYVLWAFRSAARRNPKALDDVLPKLAKQMQSIHDDRELCRYLDTFVLVDRGPPELVAAVERLFNSPEHYKFAKPRAAAVLFKLNPKRTEMLNWLAERLRCAEPHDRVTAAYALGSLERLAKPVAPKLKAAIRDADPVVRVFAAVALWKAAGDASPVLPVLRQSFAERTAPAFIRPVDVSESTGFSQKLWAAECLGEMGPSAGEAADDIPQALNDNDDSEIQLEGIRASVKIGRASPALIKSLEKLSQNPLPIVADEATAALKTLKPVK